MPKDLRLLICWSERAAVHARDHPAQRVLDLSQSKCNIDAVIRSISPVDRVIAFIMLSLRKFTESEAQVREMAEDLSHFEPRRKHSRGYALAGQLLHQRRQERFFPIRNRAPRSQPAAIRMTCWRIKSPRVRKFLTRGQERGDSVGSHG